MVTIANGAYGTLPMQLFGLSVDEKPVEGVGNASVFYEMDTQKIYMFDKANEDWLEQ